MADSVQTKELTIEALQAGIEESLRQAFPNVSVHGYDHLTTKRGTDRTRLHLPALMLSLAAVEPDAPTATGQLATSLRWELRVICSKNGGKSEIAVRELAVRVAAFVNGNRFGLPIRGAQFVAAGDDLFNPELAALEPWLVEFEQSACFGLSCFTDDFITPEEVYVSMKPKIGLKHMNDYERVTEDVIDELRDSGTESPV